MIQVSLALDHLLDTVADVAKDMRDEGTKTIQGSSMTLVGGSFFIALLNLFLGTRQKRADADTRTASAFSSEPAEPRNDDAHTGGPATPPIPGDAH